MEFSKGDLVKDSFRVHQPMIDKYLLHKMTIVQNERTVHYKVVINENNKFVLNLTYYIIRYPKGSTAVFVDSSFSYVFIVGNDRSGLDNDMIDLFRHVNTGQNKAWSYVATHEPRLPIEIGDNKDIPKLCDKIIASLTNLDFYK